MVEVLYMSCIFPCSWSGWTSRTLGEIEDTTWHNCFELKKNGRLRLDIRKKNLLWGW